MSAKRITKELAEVTASPPAGLTVKVNEADVHKWHITLDGPADSPYAGGKFQLLLDLPKDYPFKPPKLNFRTKIYHPNITNDEHGSMCLGMLKGDVWKPSSKISSVLAAAAQLLVEPVPDDAVEQTAAEMFKNNRPAFDKEAREWTKKYAK